MEEMTYVPERTSGVPALPVVERSAPCAGSGVPLPPPAAVPLASLSQVMLLGSTDDDG